MLTISLLVISLLGVLLVILGVGVFMRNTKNLLNQLFFSFAVGIALWIIINFLAADVRVTHAISLWTNRLVLVAGGAALMSLLMFILQLTRWTAKARWFKYLLAVSFVSWVLCLTPYVVKNVSVHDDQVVNSFGALAPAYFIPLFVTAAALTVVLFLSHTRLKGLLRTQVDAISVSIIATIPIIIVGNAVLPITGHYELVSYTPLALVFIEFMMAYVVVRHRLFNIRPLIVRSLAYVISLTTVSVLYALGAHYVSLMIDALHNKAVTSIANVSLVLLIITFFQPIKRVFDKATNGIFYKDAYDPQDLLSELNRANVSTLDVNVLAQGSVDIVAKYLKTQFCAISIISNDHMRTFASGQAAISDKGLKQLYSRADLAHKDIFVADETDNDQTGIWSGMDKAGVEILIKLNQGISTRSTTIGYLVIGPRKSGAAFSGGDIRVLETVVNELSLAIQNALHFEEIQQFNITLQQKVSLATRKLQKTNDKLVQMDETKDEFISMASHQLRTPLTSIKGYISMVLEGDAGDVNPMQRKMLDQAFVSSQRMVALIADLLNVSRLRTGKFVIEPTLASLAEVARGEVAQLKETAAGRGLELTLDAPKSFPLLYFDETKTRQVIMNFIDNAIYYTPSGGHIRVSVVDKPETVELTVADDGIGVPQHEQYHLFTKFYRAGNARKARPDGTGLGLFMAKKVVVAQGGAVIFKSTEGKGSTFGFTLVKSKLQPPTS